MHCYGLIGWPLGHSFSKIFFEEKFQREGIGNVGYELFPLQNIQELPKLLAQNPDLRGLNVTIPHKETVMPLLDEVTETARVVGAVNCIQIIDNQYLIGHNTDVLGFEASLLSWVTDPTAAYHKTALILGTGGAAKAVAYVLGKLGIPFQFVSRRPSGPQQIPYSALSALHPALLVNTTPLGTFPQVEQMPPVPLDFFRQGMFVYDLVYNPAETLLLREAKSRGCIVKNGLEMLELQAEAAWDIWQSPPQ